MAMSGFHRECVTIGRHRVPLECRGGFPGEEMRLLAGVAARACDLWMEAGEGSPNSGPRLVRAWLDCNSGEYTVLLASDSPEDADVDDLVTDALMATAGPDRFFAELQMSSQATSTPTATTTWRT